MLIKFLGTSSSWPMPRLNCQCKICTSSDPEDFRTRSCVLINKEVLIDAGPDLYWQLKKIDPSKIKAAVFTHAHPDHILGVHDLDHIYGIKHKILLFGTDITLKRIRQRFYLIKFNQEIIEREKPFKVENLKFIAFEVVHTKATETLGFKIKEKGKTFVYIPDFSSIPKQNFKYLKKANLLCLGGSSKDKRAFSHQPIDRSIEMIKKEKFEPRFVYFTHIGHGKDSGTFKELEKFVQETGGKNFHIAYDGLEEEV